MAGHNKPRPRSGVFYRPPPSTENGFTATMFFNEFPILLECLAVASGHLFFSMFLVLLIRIITCST